MTDATQDDAAKAAAKQAAADKKAAEKAAKDVQKAADKAAKDAEKAKADAAKAEAKAKADKEKADKKAAAEAAKAEKEAAKVKVVQPQNNGVTRPKDGTSTGKVWAMADAMSASLRQPVPISLLAPECAKAGLNDATTRTQYARWKQFNGVKGIVAKPAAPEAAAA